MLNELLNISYSSRLILLFLKSSLRGAFAAYFLGSLIICVILYSEVPTPLLLVWLLLNWSVLAYRVFLSIKLRLLLSSKRNLKAFDRENDKTQKYFNRYIAGAYLNAFILGVVAFGFTPYDISQENIFIISLIVISTIGGSVSSLTFVLISFVGFIFFISFPFTLAMALTGDPYQQAISIITLTVASIFLPLGYRIFKTTSDSFALDEKYKSIFHKSPDGISIFKGTRKFECNQTILCLFGYEDDKSLFMKTNIANLSPKYQEDNTNSSRKMLRLLKLAYHKKISFEWQHMKRDGEIFWVEITLNPIYLDGEKVIHGVWRDIGHQKIAQKELSDLHNSLEMRVKEGLEKNKLKDQQLIQQSRLAHMGEMISMIAHQWRQPLNAISLTSSNLKLKCMIGNIEDDYFEQELSLIDEYSHHLSETINDFRNFFKNDNTKQTTNIDSIIASTLSIVQVSLEVRNIKIITSLNSKQSIETYASELKQVILNLIKNAEDALIEEKTVNPTITIITEENFISISDNAGGIPDDIIMNIFDPYFSTKLEKDGTGLGLYMSKTIVEEHCDAKLVVKNDKDGAVFTIDFN